MSSNIRVPKICENCGTTFEAKTFKTRYCSTRCNNIQLKILARQKKMHEFVIKQNTDLIKNKEVPQISILKEKDFLSISEAAEYLGISKRTIERAIAEKSIEVIRIKRRVLIPKKNIEKLTNL